MNKHESFDNPYPERDTRYRPERWEYDYPNFGSYSSAREDYLHQEYYPPGPSPEYYSPGQFSYNYPGMKPTGFLNNSNPRRASNLPPKPKPPLSGSQYQLFKPLIDYLLKLYPYPSNSAQIGQYVMPLVKRLYPTDWKLHDYINSAAKLSILELVGKNHNGQIQVVLSKEFSGGVPDSSACRYCNKQISQPISIHYKECIKLNTPKLQPEIHPQSSEQTLPNISQPTAEKGQFQSKLAAYISDSISPAETSLSSNSTQNVDDFQISLTEPPKVPTKPKRSSAKAEKDLDFIHDDEFNFHLTHQTDYLGVRKTRSGKVYMPTPVVDADLSTEDMESIGTVSLQSDYEMDDTEEEVVELGTVEPKRKIIEAKPAPRKRAAIISDSDSSDVPMLTLSPAFKRMSKPIIEHPAVGNKLKLAEEKVASKNTAEKVAKSKDNDTRQLKPSYTPNSSVEPNIIPQKKNAFELDTQSSRSAVSSNTPRPITKVNTNKEKPMNITSRSSEPLNPSSNYQTKSKDLADKVDNRRKRPLPEPISLPKRNDSDEPPAESYKAVHIEKPLNTKEAAQSKAVTPIEIPEVYVKSYRKPATAVTERQNSSPSDHRKIKFAPDTRHYVHYVECSEFGLLPELSPNVKNPDKFPNTPKSILKNTSYNPYESITMFKEEFGTPLSTNVAAPIEQKRLSFLSYMSSRSTKKPTGTDKRNVSPMEELDLAKVSSPVNREESLSKRPAEPQVNDFKQPQNEDAKSSGFPKTNSPKLKYKAVRKPGTDFKTNNSYVTKVLDDYTPTATANALSEEKKFDSNGRAIMCAKCKNVESTPAHTAWHAMETLKQRLKKD
ncbi:hypothetical protein HDV01_001173 [Terramyces sp. JEL0728]|nr:hypothetical protein HDV01_001173 [Terramyces sp. JEL0728]